nr:formin-like protein 3 [Aegilops tauschii subsp. strangulata]
MAAMAELEPRRVGAGLLLPPLRPASLPLAPPPPPHQCLPLLLPRLRLASSFRPLIWRRPNPNALPRPWVLPRPAPPVPLAVAVADDRGPTVPPYPPRRPWTSSSSTGEQRAATPVPLAVAFADDRGPSMDETREGVCLASSSSQSPPPSPHSPLPPPFISRAPPPPLPSPSVARITCPPVGPRWPDSKMAERRPHP